MEEGKEGGKEGRLNKGLCGEVNTASWGSGITAGRTGPGMQGLCAAHCTIPLLGRPQFPRCVRLQVPSLEK